LIKLLDGAHVHLRFGGIEVPGVVGFGGALPVRGTFPASGLIGFFAAARTGLALFVRRAAIPVRFLFGVAGALIKVAGQVALPLVVLGGVPASVALPLLIVLAGAAGRFRVARFAALRGLLRLFTSVGFLPGILVFARAFLFGFVALAGVLLLGLVS
jgi:hypothetical protein